MRQDLTSRHLTTSPGSRCQARDVRRETADGRWRPVPPAAIVDRLFTLEPPMRRHAIALLSLLAAPVLAQDPTPIRANAPVKRQIAAGQAQSFAIELAAKTFVYGEAEQETVDLVVTVFDPDGRRMVSFDDPSRGPEPF